MGRKQPRTEEEEGTVIKRYTSGKRGVRIPNSPPPPLNEEELSTRTVHFSRVTFVKASTYLPAFLNVAYELAYNCWKIILPVNAHLIPPAKT